MGFAVCGGLRPCILSGLAWSARLLQLKTVYYTVFFTLQPSRVRIALCCAKNKKADNESHRHLAEMVGFAVCGGLRPCILSGLAWSARLLQLKTVYYTVFFTLQPSRVRIALCCAKNKKADNVICRPLAEMVGFEPTCRLITDKTISSRSRYDHFDTSPYIAILL